MPNSLTTTTHFYKKDNRFAHYSILIIFLLSLLGSIHNIEHEAIIPFMPVALLGTLTGCVFSLLLIKGFNVAALRSPLFLGINSFGLLITLSIAYSKYPLLTASRSLQFIIVANSLYLILSHVMQLKELFERASKIIIAFTFLASVYGIIIYHFGTAYSSNNIWVTGIKVLGIEFNQRMYGHRISSYVGNPNPFGFQIMVSTLACLYFLTVYRKKWYFILLLIFLYTLLLTGSRASTVSLIGGAAFFLNYSLLKNNLGTAALRVLLVGLALIVGSYLILSPEFVKEVFSVMGRESNTLSGRELAWNAIIKQFKETPFFGVGYRVSTEAILEENTIPVAHSHNLYLAILSEIGVLGFSIFSFIFIWPLLCFMLSKRNKNISKLNTICLSILAACIINQFFENMFEPLSFFFILIFLLVFILFSKKQT